MIVLYAEDDIDDFGTLCEILESIDPSVKILNARTGVEALEVLENSVVLPDYIFLDINMPALDGKACLKHIKKDPRFSSIPVIIYTTSKDKKDIELCKQLGASDYIIKANSYKEAHDSISKVFK